MHSKFSLSGLVTLSAAELFIAFWISSLIAYFHLILLLFGSSAPLIVFSGGGGKSALQHIFAFSLKVFTVSVSLCSEGSLTSVGVEVLHSGEVILAPGFCQILIPVFRFYFYDFVIKFFPHA